MDSLMCRSFIAVVLVVLMSDQEVLSAESGLQFGPPDVAVGLVQHSASAQDEECHVYAPLISRLFAADNQLLDHEGRYITPRRLDQDGDGVLDARVVTVLDLNQDKKLDECDLDVWYERLDLVPAMPDPVDLDGDGIITENDLKGMNGVRVLGRDVFAEYDPILDIDGSGEVNRLDFSLLTCEIARHRARLGLDLIWNGNRMDPNRTPVHFDGVSVLSATPEDVRYLAELDTHSPAGPVPGSFGQEGFWSDPRLEPSAPAGPPDYPPGDCPAITTDSGWPTRNPRPIYTDEWDEEHATFCFGGGGAIAPVLYRCTLTLTPGYYNDANFQLACGVYEMPVSYQYCRTIESHVSVEAGAKIDAIVNMGVTWGASRSDTACWTVSPNWSKLGTPLENCDVEYYIRFLKWTVSVTKTMQGDPPGLWACLDRHGGSESDVIKRPSCQTRTVTTCWCGCQVEPED